jgi:hypothetical protein
MPYLVERNTSRASEVDSQAIKRETRTFTTNYLSKEAVMVDPLLPPLNSVHPNDPTLKADNYRFYPKTDGTWDVDVTYTSNGMGKFTKRIDKPSTYFRAMAGNIKQVRTPIPSFTIRKTTVTSGSSSGEMKIWEPANFEIEEVFAVAQFTVIVPALSFDDLYTIAKQVGKVHEIPTGSQRYWQFTMPMIRPFDNEQDQITYEWFNDPGTRQPANLPFQSPKNQLFPPPITVTGLDGTYWRAPYTKIVAIPGNPPSVGTQPPEPTYSFLYTAWADHDGWSSLPGLDRL